MESVKICISTGKKARSGLVKKNLIFLFLLPLYFRRFRAAYALTSTLMDSGLVCIAMASGSASSENVCVRIGAI